MLAQLSEIEESVDASQEVIARHVTFEIECVEQPILNDALTHHDAYRRRWREACKRRASSQDLGDFFNTIRCPFRPFALGVRF
jgi:hypothetical protein